MSLRRIALFAALAAATLALASCGGDEEQGSGPDSDPTNSGALAELEQCLADQGVELPDRGDGPSQPPSGEPPGGTPPGGGPPQLDDELRDAMEECSELLPEAPGGGRQPPGGGFGAPSS